MKNETRILGAVVAVLLTAVVAPARAQVVDMVARVPFEFYVGDEAMPGDVYHISRAQHGSGTLMLRSERKGAIVLAQQGGPYRRLDNPKLVFHRVGDQYFLREVQLVGSSALELPETQGEREAVQRIASSAPAGVRRVVIAAPR